MSHGAQGGWEDPFDAFDDYFEEPSQPRHMVAPSGVPSSGMYVEGYSRTRKPSLYDKNPLATMTLIAGFLAMISTLIPNIGSFVAIPMGICASVLGCLGVASAKKRGNDRGDIAVAGIVLGVASLIVVAAMTIVSRNVLSDKGTDSMAIATETDDESLDALATTKAATDAFGDIVGNDWGTGETRNLSSEVISLKKDMSFMAWTVDYDGSLSEWSGQYSLTFGKEALDLVAPATQDVIRDEIEKSPKFTERGLVAIKMEVNEVDGDRSSPVTLIMIGHYLKNTHQLFMREANAPLNTPTVMNLLDDHESGIT